MRCDVLVLGATVKLTEPVPEPVAPALTVIQVTLLTAVQEQPVVVVTVVDASAPAAGTDWVEGEIENEHPAGSCVTENVCPPTVSVPVRGLVLALAATLKLTEPLPVPVAPLVTVNHPVSLLTPVHEHPDDAVIVAEPVPPAATTDWLVGASAYVHGAAACVTEKVCPPMVSVPPRGLVLGFAVALNATEPFPLPVAPRVTVNHPVSLLTPVHEHPDGAVIVVEPVPPPARTAWLVGESAYVHGAAACVTENVWPPMVRVPLRGVPLGFAVALKLTDPGPLPAAPLVTVNHPVSLLTPVHEHPARAVTAVEPVPPPATTAWLVGASAYVHDAAACVTENVCPPMVSVPLRGLVLGLDEALNATEPLPLPVAPLVTVNQDVLLLTPVQVHPAGAVTLVEPVPPPATTDWLAGEIE